MFTLYNIMCDDAPGLHSNAETLVDQGIIPLLLRRMVTFATTEFIMPAMDVLFCTLQSTRAKRQIIENLNCLLAIKVPTIPIIEHNFGTTSSYKPFVCKTVLVLIVLVCVV